MSSELRIGPGDTHSIAYRSWASSGTMTMSIDRGSDGTVDQTVVLANQGETVFLPLVTR